MYLEQGDCLIHKEKFNEKDMTLLDHGILAFGEKTNHSHALQGSGFRLFETKEKVKYLRVVEPTELKHQEHKSFVIPPGDYRIGIVQEYSHFDEEARNVAD